MKEEVILVDRDDVPLGRIEKLAAHQQGLCHRAFSVFVLRQHPHHSAWQVLLQKRSAAKYHCAGLWSNTCCSHPRPGESVNDAAKRRLMMEMGLDNIALQVVGKFHYRAALENGLIEEEVDHVLIGRSDVEHPPFNCDEVAETRWVDVDVLQAELRRTPEIFTPWFSEALAMILSFDLSAYVV